MKYVIQNEVVKAGMLSDVQNMIPKKVQPLLDAGVAKGWRLHTLIPTESTKGINIVIVWETD